MDLLPPQLTRTHAKRIGGTPALQDENDVLAALGEYSTVCKNADHGAEGQNADHGAEGQNADHGAEVI